MGVTMGEVFVFTRAVKGWAVLRGFLSPQRRSSGLLLRRADVMLRGVEGRNRQEDGADGRAGVVEMLA